MIEKFFLTSPPPPQSSQTKKQKKGLNYFCFIDFVLLQSLVTFWEQIFGEKHFFTKICAPKVTNLCRQKQNKKKNNCDLFLLFFFRLGVKQNFHSVFFFKGFTVVFFLGRWAVQTFFLKIMLFLVHW